MGEKAETVFEQLVFLTEKSPDIYEHIVERFVRYFKPQMNYLHYRVQFNNRSQRQGESVEAYIKELHILVAKCNFDDRGSTMLNRLLRGTLDKQLSIELQLQEGITLAAVIDKMRAKSLLLQNLNAEAVLSQEHYNSNSGNADAIAKFTKNTSNMQSMQEHRRNSKEYLSDYPNGKRRRRFCDLNHPPRKCPAYGQICRKCKGKNHFARVCKQRAIVNVVHEASNQDNAGVDDNSCEFFMGAIDFSNAENNWNVEVLVNGSSMLCEADSGAQCNVIPLEILKANVNCFEIFPTKAKLSAYTGHDIPVVGEIDLEVGYNSAKFLTRFYVFQVSNVMPILRLAALRKMGLVPHSVSALSVDKNYTDVFAGLGCLEGEYEIKLKPDAKPVVCVPRRVPESIKPKLKTEIERLEYEGVFAKCIEPSEWVSHTVHIVRGNKALRLCLDPQYLNKAIFREHFELPRESDIFSRISKAQVFSTLDAASGFHQVRLCEKSSKLISFITPFGRYRFLRLPFGLSCSPEVYHKRVSQIFDDIKGVETYIDDILVWGSAQVEHDRRLKQVLDRCREKNFKLNKSKCHFSEDSVKFLGHVTSKSGLSPKHDKVDAVNRMLEPSSVADVRRFLGMVNYLSKFCPNIADLTAPVRAVCKPRVEFVWGRPQQEAFDKIKKLIAAAPVLKLFDPGDAIVLTADASSVAMGAVLMQSSAPVEYAVKSLSDTQKIYAQIEKELLAVLFACQRFHSYVYG